MDRSCRSKIASAASSGNTVQPIRLIQAFDVLKGLMMGGEGAPGVPVALQVKAWISLIGWTVLPLLAALAIFERQDLSKE